MACKLIFFSFSFFDRLSSVEDFILFMLNFEFYHGNFSVTLPEGSLGMILY